MASIELGHLAIKFERLSPLRGCLPQANSTVRIAFSRHRILHPSSCAQPSLAQETSGCIRAPCQRSTVWKHRITLALYSLGPSAIASSIQQRATVSITTDGPAYRVPRHSVRRDLMSSDLFRVCLDREGLSDWSYPRYSIRLLLACRRCIRQ
jgi:hypothetical protein